MDSFFTLVLMTFSFMSLKFHGSYAQTQSIKSPHVLDLFIRDYTFKSLDKSFKTGISQSVTLPSNFSGIKVDTLRLRCGSLTRYGAKLKEFHLVIGVTIHPCIERVMLIRQSIEIENNIINNWSSIYYENYNDLSKYQLVSPIVGILAYNANDEDSNSSSNPFQLGIEGGENLITIDFNNVTNFNKKDVKGLYKMKPLCASFEVNGKMTLEKTKPLATLVCVAKRHEHFGLVIESLQKQEQDDDDEIRKPIKLSQWKIAVGSTIGAALGAFLLGLLLVAMLVRVKKRTRMVEMVRRSYEEEALQVSMVGHVRAPIAPATRTTSTLEQHDYVTRHSR